MGSYSIPFDPIGKVCLEVQPKPGLHFSSKAVILRRGRSWQIYRNWVCWLCNEQETILGCDKRTVNNVQRTWGSRDGSCLHIENLERVQSLQQLQAIKILDDESYCDSKKVQTVLAKVQDWEEAERFAGGLTPSLGINAKGIQATMAIYQIWQKGWDPHQLLFYPLKPKDDFGKVQVTRKCLDCKVVQC